LLSLDNRERTAVARVAFILMSWSLYFAFPGAKDSFSKVKLICNFAAAYAWFVNLFQWATVLGGSGKDAKFRDRWKAETAMTA
jgi:hypothetical protein